MDHNGVKKFGLYNSENEHDSCGIGFIAHIKGQKSFRIIRSGLEILENMAPSWRRKLR